MAFPSPTIAKFYYQTSAHSTELATIIFFYEIFHLPVCVLIQIAAFGTIGSQNNFFGNT